MRSQFLFDFLRAVFQVRHIRFFNLSLSVWHLVELGQHAVHDLVFTVSCGALYLYAFELEKVAKTWQLKFWRWFVILIACALIGVQLTRDKFLQSSENRMSVWIAASVIAVVPLFLEVTAFQLQEQSDRTCLFSGPIIACGCGERLQPIDCSNPGTLRIDVKGPANRDYEALLYNLQDLKFHVVAPLDRKCEIATIEIPVTAGRYWLGIKNLDPVGPRIHVHVNVTLKNG